jgi:hypothetical protein
MVEIEYYHAMALVKQSSGESAVKWIEENKKKVEECLSFINSSPFNNELRAHFTMWQEYISPRAPTTNYVCVVDSHGVWFEVHEARQVEREWLYPSHDETAIIRLGKVILQ